MWGPAGRSAGRLLVVVAVVRAERALPARRHRRGGRRCGRHRRARRRRRGRYGRRGRARQLLRRVDGGLPEVAPWRARAASASNCASSSCFSRRWTSNSRAPGRAGVCSGPGRWRRSRTSASAMAAAAATLLRIAVDRWGCPASHAIDGCLYASFSIDCVLMLASRKTLAFIVDQCVVEYRSSLLVQRITALPGGRKNIFFNSRY